MKLLHFWWQGRELMTLYFKDKQLRLEYTDTSYQKVEAPNPLSMNVFRAYGEWRLYEVALTKTADAFQGTIMYRRRSSIRWYDPSTSFSTSKIPLLFTLDYFTIIFGQGDRNLQQGESPIYFLLKKLYISTIPNDPAYPAQKNTNKCYYDWSYDFQCSQETYFLSEYITYAISPTAQEEQGVWIPADGYLNITSANQFSPTFSAAVTARGDCDLNAKASGILFEFLDTNNEPLMRMDLASTGIFTFTLLGQTLTFAQPDAIECDQWFKATVNVLPSLSLVPQKLRVQFLVKYKSGSKSPAQSYLEYPTQLAGTYQGSLIIARTFQGLMWRFYVAPILRGYIIYMTFAIPESSLLDCPHNSYEDCQICDPKCGSCTGPTASDCLSCHDLLTPLSTCECPLSYYYHSTTDACLSCENDLCTGCLNPSQCTACRDQAYFISALHTCVAHCPSGYKPDHTLHKCEPCPSHCLECDSLTTCLECQSPYSLYQSLCTLTCPDSYYESLSLPKECLSCPQHCSTCSSPSQCLSCIAPYSLRDGWCEAHHQCPSHFYYDSATLTCVQCSFECAECTHSSDNCKLCASSYFFLPVTSAHCVHCPPGFIQSGQSCLQICGDGLYVGNQECDDGNLLPDDGCSPTCEIQPKAHCNSPPTECFPSQRLDSYKLDNSHLTLNFSKPFPPPTQYNSSILGSLSCYSYSLSLLDSSSQTTVQFLFQLKSDFLGSEYLQLTLDSGQNYNFNLAIQIPPFLYSFDPMAYSVFYILLLFISLIFLALQFYSERNLFLVIFFFSKLQYLNLLLKLSIYQSGFLYYFLHIFDFSTFSFSSFASSYSPSSSFNVYSFIASISFCLLSCVFMFQKSIISKKIGIICLHITYLPLLMNSLQGYIYIDYSLFLQYFFILIAFLIVALPFCITSFFTSNPALRLSIYFFTQSALIAAIIYFLRSWTYAQFICILILFSVLAVCDILYFFPFSQPWTRTLAIISVIIEICALSLLFFHIEPHPFFASLSALTFILLGCVVIFQLTVQFAELLPSLKRKPQKVEKVEEKERKTSEVAIVAVEGGMESDTILRSLQDN